MGSLHGKSAELLWRQAVLDEKTVSAFIRYMGRDFLTAVTMFYCAVFTSAAQTNSPSWATRDMAALTNTTMIVITEFKDNETNRMHVVKPHDVYRLMQTLDLQPKRPCYCGHMHSARFTTPAGVVEASFCNHCFDIIDPTTNEGVRYYEMPKAFYSELRRQVREYSGFDLLKRY